MTTRPHLIAALAIVTLAGCRAEAPWPSRPITLICPWAAGGGTDRTSRYVAAFLEQELGVPVNVVNATGGAGVTGHSRGLRARPDGYTITMMTVELNMLHWRGLTRISWREAAPLMSLNQDAAALFVRAGAPWADAAALVADVRENPGRLTASGTATGGIWHLGLAGLLNAVGLSADDVRWIPMGGAGPSLQELASGGLDIVVCSLPEAATLYRGGQVRCLGVMAEDRVAGYEEVPTLFEQGIDWSLTGWRGVGVPRDTPRPIVERLVAALERITAGEVRVAGKTFPEYLDAEGFDRTVTPPGEFAAMLAELDEKFGAILTSPEFAHVSTAPIGRHVFPAILAALLLVLVAATALSRWLAARPARVSRPVRDEPLRGERDVTARSVRNVVAVLVAIAAYVFLAEWLGFVLVAGAVFFTLAVMLGARPWSAALVALVLVPGLYQLFGHVLGVPLPGGLVGW